MKKKPVYPYRQVPPVNPTSILVSTSMTPREDYTLFLPSEIILLFLESLILDRPIYHSTPLPHIHPSIKPPPLPDYSSFTTTITMPASEGPSSEVGRQVITQVQSSPASRVKLEGNATIADTAKKSIVSLIRFASVCRRWRLVVQRYHRWVTSAILFAISDKLLNFSILNSLYSFIFNASSIGKHSVDIGKFKCHDISPRQRITTQIPGPLITIDESTNFIYVLLEWKSGWTYSSLVPVQEASRLDMPAFFQLGRARASGKIILQFFYDLRRGVAISEEVWRRIKYAMPEGYPDPVTILTDVRDDPPFLEFTRDGLGIPVGPIVTPYSLVMRVLAWIGIKIVEIHLDDYWINSYLAAVYETIFFHGTRIRPVQGPSVPIVSSSVSFGEVEEPEVTSIPNTTIPQIYDETDIACKSGVTATGKKLLMRMKSLLKEHKENLLATFDLDRPTGMAGVALVDYIMGKKEHWEGLMVTRWTELEIQLRELVPENSSKLLSRACILLCDKHRSLPCFAIRIEDTYLYAIMYWRAPPCRTWYWERPLIPAHETFPLISSMKVITEYWANTREAEDIGDE